MHTIVSGASIKMGDLGWCFVFEALFLLSDCATDAKQDGTNHRSI